MIIKFLSNGTGDPQLAASYLIGEHDHLGDKRAGVEIVRGDPIVFAAIASSLNFKYCYTSVVINWSPEDVVSDQHLNEVLDLFEEHAFSGFRSDQYHMTAVMHADDDGSRHLHILIPNRSRQDDQTLSSRTQQRSFLERTHRFVRDVKNKIGDTFRKVIDQFTDTTSDKSESRAKFEALSQCFDAVGIDRLVHIARQRTERRQRIESVKRFKQDLERSKESAKQKLALNTMSAELSRIQDNYPQLELKTALGFVSTAESYFHQFHDANKSDEDIDLYLGEYVYSIDECFKSLEQKLDTMQPEEVEALKKLSAVIEDHLGQIQFETILEDGVVHYESASQEVKVLVAEFREKLSKHEKLLINNMLSVDGLSYSDFDKIKAQGDRLYGSYYDNFS